MKDLSSVETLTIPAGVSVKVKARKVTVEGPRGTLHKNVGHVAMDIQIVSRNEATGKRRTRARAGKEDLGGRLREESFSGRERGMSRERQGRTGIADGLGTERERRYDRVRARKDWKARRMGV